jgi:hypothetical protein
LKDSIIPFFDSKETNHLISLLILQIVLTENRKLKTENGIRGQETRVSGLTIREISANIIARTKSKFGLRGFGVN